MLNASVGMQRVLARLIPDPHRPSQSSRLHRRSVRTARAVQAHLHARPSARPLGPTLPHLARLRRPSVTLERALPVGIATLVVAASIVSVAPAPGGPVGGPTGDGPEPRLVAGGIGFGFGRGDFGFDGSAVGLLPALTEEEEPEAAAPEAELEFRPLVVGPIDAPPVDGPVAAPAEEAALEGPFLEDGTLLAGFAPDTTVEDGSDKLRSYRVKAGDTLVGIARKFGVSMMTVWWANDLSSKSDLHVGQRLTIPPVSGLVVDVTAGDTLESIAARYGVSKQDILEENGLEDPNLVIGQTLIVPGALGEGIATPKPTPRRVYTPTRSSSGSRSNSSGGSSGGSVRPPTRYSGGSMAWPVVGGGNYISQYYRSGHYGLDIAATYGSRVRAAAAGRVIFAGWKSNGGGYQVWIAHGSGLYTTYNHMSGVSVGRGQYVGKGQQVGRIGCTGMCTGPHLHFEVWRGEIWSGGRRVNPLSYL